MTTFYWSDLHIGHRLVAAERGFFDEDNMIPSRNPDASLEGYPEWESSPDPVAHNEWLARTWDAAVHPRDTVWILGDVAVSGFPRALQWLKERPGTKHLVAGNHDPVHPMHRTAQKVLRHWLIEGGGPFSSVQSFARRRTAAHGGPEFLLSHFPYVGDHTATDRNMQYRLPDLGLPLVHGHTHGKEVESFSHIGVNGPQTQGTRMFHVGVDAHPGGPVPHEVIVDWLIEPRLTYFRNLKEADHA